MKLFIAGFPNDFDDADLKDMFELYGTVTSASFVTDRFTGKSKGFGFVDMPENTEALETIGVLNGTKIKGRQITVQKAEERGAGGGNSRPPRDNFNKPRDNFNRRY